MEICPHCRQTEAANQRHYEELQHREAEERRRRQEQEEYEALPDCLFCGKKFKNQQFFEYCSKKCLIDDLGRSDAQAYLEEKEEEKAQLEAEAQRQYYKRMRQAKIRQEQEDKRAEKKRLEIASEIINYFFQFKSTATTECKEKVLLLDLDSILSVKGMINNEIKAKNNVFILWRLSLISIVIGILFGGIGVLFSNIFFGILGGFIVFCCLISLSIFIILKILLKCGLSFTNGEYPLTNSMERIYSKPNNPDGATYDGKFSFFPKK